MSAEQHSGFNLPVVIIGAGPAGLATAFELSRRGIPYRLVERGPSLGTSWVNAYDSLRLHTGRHMSTLPGMRYPEGTPLFPSRAEFVTYLQNYATVAGIAVETGREVTSLERKGDRWIVRLGDDTIEASAVVMATGIMSKPFVAPVDGQDRCLTPITHSVEYKRPDAFRGKRVLVVGVGNSGGEIAAELGNAGVETTILVRRGANVVPRDIGGIPIQYLSAAMKRLPQNVRRRIARGVQKLAALRRGPPVIPLPPWTAADAIPVIGFHLVDAIRAGCVKLRLGTIDRLESTMVHFSDGTVEEFDHIIMATGFRPALDVLGSLIRRDQKGFAIRTDDITSADQEGLFFVGSRYDTTGAIANIKADARRVGRLLAARTVRREMVQAVHPRPRERS